MTREGTRGGSKERFWRRMLRQWRQSGQSVRAFCADHDLAEPSFYAWRRTLAERDTRPQPAFVPLQVTPPRPTPASATLTTTAAALEVVLGRCVLRVAPGFDAVTLRQLLAVLENT